MKKILLLIIAAALLLLLLAIPAAIGQQAEARYRHVLDQLQRNGLRIVDSDYRRGWLQAEASTEFELAAPGPAPGSEQGDPRHQPLRFVLDSQISHGPYSPRQGLVPASFTVDTRIHSTDGSLFPIDYPGQIRTRVGWAGAGTTLIELPRYERPARAGQIAIRFDGVHGRILHDLAFTFLDAELSAPLVLFGSEEQPLLEVRDAAFHSDHRRSAEGLMVGQARFALARLHLRGPEDSARMDLRDLSMAVENTTEQGMASGHFDYRLEAATLDGTTYGPMRLDIRASNLASATLARLQQALEDIAAQPIDEEQRAVAVLGALIGSGPELLAGDPRLAIEQIHIDTPEGPIEGHFELQPHGLQWEQLSDGATVLDKLGAEATLRMPEKYFHTLFARQARQGVLNQIEQQGRSGTPVEEPDPAELEAWASEAASQQIEGLLAQEILLRDGQQLGTAISLKNGLLSINGKAVPLPLLTGATTEASPAH